MERPVQADSGSLRPHETPARQHVARGVVADCLVL